MSAVAFTAPASGGTIRRGRMDATVIVGRFEELPGVTMSSPRVLMPELSACTAPLRVTITAADARVKGSEEILTLRDSSGKHVYTGTQDALESNYLVVFEDAAGTGYVAVPVSHWLSFTRASTAEELSPEEQDQLYLKAQVRKPSRLFAGRGAVRNQANGMSSGVTDGADDLEIDVGAVGGSYRTSMASAEQARARASSRRAAAGGATTERIEAGVDGGDMDFEERYAHINGGHNEDEGDDDEGGGDRRGARGGQDNADDGGREFDVVGDEERGYEEAADLGEVDWFEDDAGDDGDLGDLGDLDRAGGREPGEDDVAVAAADDDELLLGGDDDGDGDALLSRAIEEEATRNKSAADAAADAAAAAARRGAGSDGNAHPAKRPRLAGAGAGVSAGGSGATGGTDIAADIVSFLRSQGGRATSSLLTKNSHFKNFMKVSDTNKARFKALLKELTVQENGQDGKTVIFVLKK